MAPIFRTETEGATGRIVFFPKSRPAGRSGPLTLLVVEDHSSLREVLALYLGRFGYRILSARDGAAALGILEAEEVHVILLDLMLPHVDGFELLRELGQRRRDGLPYVIVVSAILSDEKRQQALSLGADEYVSKPFNLSNLLERIRAIEERL